MASAWSKSETLKLIEVWGEDNIQEQLEGCHRNREVYMRIARKLNDCGYERSFEQCREKIKKLKKEYRRIKDRLEETGRGRDEEVQWSYYDVMDQILGHKPSTVPESVVDSLALTQSRETISESPETPEVDETLFGEDSNADETVAPASTKPSDDITLQTKKGNSSTKKKKRSRGDQFELVMNGVMKELVSAQERNEERHLELEEKRMKMEEKMFEKEIEMQRESRQFQLQMMQMMTSLVNSHSSPSFPPPMATSTQYPHLHRSMYSSYDDDDLTQI